MTTISTTAIGPPLEAEGTAAGGSRGLVAVGVVAALAAIALAASCLTESDLEAGGWVRSALVVVWALAAIVLALRAARPRWGWWWPARPSSGGSAPRRRSPPISPRST